MSKHIKRTRLNQLPDPIRMEIIEARKRLGWSQAELGSRIGLPQVHISNLETGKVVPRFDTLLDLVRILGLDLLMVPRQLVPAVQALLRDYVSGSSDSRTVKGERPLYAMDPSEEYGSDET